MEKEIELSITSFCQAKCPSCSRTEIVKRQPGELKVQHVPFDKISNVIKNISADTTVTLCGEYGDPMMHPDVEQIINLFSENGNNVFVHTNGGLRSPDMYKRLAKLSKVRFSFGIDGLDAETSGKYRIDVDWNRAWENMHAWFESGGRGEWFFLIFDFNKHQISHAWNHAQKHNIDITFKVNNRWYGYVGDQEYNRIKKEIDEKFK